MKSKSGPTEQAIVSSGGKSADKGTGVESASRVPLRAQSEEPPATVSIRQGGSMSSGGSVSRSQGENPKTPDFMRKRTAVKFKPITGITKESAALYKNLKTTTRNHYILIGFIQNGKVILKSIGNYGHKGFIDTGQIKDTPDLLGFVLWKKGSSIELHPFSELNTKVDPLEGALPKVIRAQLKNLLGL